MKQKNFTFSFVLFLLTSGILFAQKITVKGSVTDERGVSMPGVNILEKGTSNTTTSGLDGDFAVSVNKGSVLLFSFVGYKMNEATVTGSILNVKMNPDSKELDAVTVTAFSIKNKTKSLGYASQTLKASDIERPGQLNALESLQGGVAGVTISKTSGGVGAGVDIVIRGVSSLDPSNNNQPLIIIDGNPVNNSTAIGNVAPSKGSNSVSSGEQFSFSNRAIDINPEDIESYTVLKGAGATALYGILAGNGVIIITTKRGKEGKPKISINSSISFSEVNHYPELQSKYREGLNGASYVKSTVSDSASGFEWVNPASPGGFWSFGPEYSSSDGAGIKYRNFYKDFFKTGVTQNLGVSVSGGTEKINYFVSASTSKDDGIVPNTSYQRKTFKANGGYQISEKFRIGSSFAYTKSGGIRSNNGDKSVMSSLAYWSPSIDVNDYLTAAGKEKDYTNGIIDQPRYFTAVSNLKDDVNRIIASADFNYQATSWLNFVYRASVDNYSETRNRYVPANLDVGTAVNGFILDENIGFTGLNSSFVITANKKFGNFNTTLTLGNQILDTKNTYSNVRGEGIFITDFNNISNATNLFAYNSGEERVRNVGNFFEAKADYKEIIYLGVTGRYDQVSTLPVKNNKFDYYSANLSFLFGDLIDQNKSVLSYGKLRTSWAQSGKTPPFAIFRKNIKDVNFPFNGVGGVSATSVDANPNLKAEIISTWEIGTDLRFFRDRIRLEYTYFNRVSEDQIIQRIVPQSSSITAFWDNGGSLKTTGNELTLGADWFKNPKFSWTSTLNFTQYKTKVTALPFENIIFGYDSQATNITSQVRLGDAAGTLYGQSWQRVDGKVVIGANGLPVFNKTSTGAIAIGKIGEAFPDWVATLNNTFKIKNFDIGFLLEYKKGGDAYDTARRNGIRNGVLGVTADRSETAVLDGVKSDGAGGYVPNDIPINKSLRNNYYNNTIYNTAADALIQDASWFKLRNVSVTYNMTKEALKTIGVSNLSFTVSGSNFLIWTPFDGFDPEGSSYSAGTNVYGFTGLTTPLTQSYSFSINLGF
ncbi:SusC/RagA family TonB-linked outer membrane protein [Flavobacterium sp. B183]|uniref:SusC/RagA family TonB-linked outer membrane protein n=1 Tax=Flavobacterium sp. B183 TaxID=907046 RepID=UPI00201F2EC3|nr:SusC/RagA family TonB-linked outer membrane protein [Flavobacterium sp. B183]URC14897.1 SusC/RagA family TonB-linked outer membrane protein [Flavobacterium sp. B183]